MGKKLRFLCLSILFTLACNKSFGQYGCYTPSLGVYDANTFSPLSAIVSCTYSNLIAITPESVFSGTTATLPCMQIKFSLTNANSATNNSLTVYQNTTVASSLCSSTCFSNIPNSSSYSFALAGLNPTQSHSYSLCNVATAGAFNYSVTSCYSNVVLASGSWLNSTPNNCQPVFIPANAIIGTVGFTISPGVPSTASITSPAGYLYLDTYQMTAGTYTVTYFFNSQAGCTTTVTRTLQITNPFNASWTAIPNQCANGTCVNLTPQITGNTGGIFLGTGVSSNSFCPVSSGVGTFPVTYTVGITPQCGSTFSNNLTVVAAPIANAGSTKSLTCASATATITASGGGTYNWTGPSILSQSGANATVFGVGNYSVLVTSAAGCTAQAVTSVVLNTVAPSVSTNAPSNLITCSSNNAILSLSSPLSGVTYAWSGPGISGASNTSAITATLGGTYNVVVTNTANGCSTNSANVVASQNTTVTNTPSTTGVLTCTSNVVNLSTTASAPIYSILWTAPSGATLSSNSNQNTTATLNNGGTFSVSVLNSINGCTSVATVAASVNTTVITPTVIATPAALNCTLTSTNLTGNPASGVSYSWSGPSGFTSSTQNPSVLNAGVYTLIITNNTNGCQSAVANGTVNVTQSLAAPVINPTSATNSTLTCIVSGSIVTLSANATPVGTSFVWAGGSILSGGTTGTASVNGSGQYTLTATHPGTGCQSTSIFTVNSPASAQTPTLSNLNATISCSQTTATTSISNSGIISYIWSGPGIVGSSTGASITASLAGTYNFTITNASNCPSPGAFVVTSNTTTILPNASTSNTVNCISTSANISTAVSPIGSSYTYSWSSGATTSSISVNPTSSTNYTVVITNTVNGCKGTQVVTVNANTNPPTAVALNPPTFTLACSPPNTTLTASATGAGSFSWASSTSGTIAAITSTLNVSSAGVYSVVAIGSNGCSSAAQTATITANTNAPIITLSNSSPSITCLTSSPSVSVTITSTVPITSYSWSPSAGILGATNQSVVTFSAPGVYSGVITAANGCPTNTVITVTSATTAPTIVAGTGTAQSLSCSNSTVTIAPVFTPSTNLTYSWTGTGIVGNSSNISVQVNQNGNYNLIVTNTLTGCSNSSISVSVNGSNIPPNLNVASSSTIGISCQPNTNTVNLTANSTGIVTYNWSNGATSSVITTANAGTYSVTVTDISTNCTTSSVITVANNTIVPTLTTSAAASLPCGGGTVALNASSSNTNVSYSWQGLGVVSGSNAASATINSGGVYTISVIDNVTNCINTQTVSVSQTSVVAQFTANPIVGPAPLTVNFTNQSTGAVSYSWGFGNGTSTQQNPSNTYPLSGTYTVVLTAVNGACTSTIDIVVTVQEGLGVIPEVFTPNGDQYNNTFEIKGLDSYPNNSLQVFNRWGNLIYSAKPYKNDWNGSANVSGKTGSDKLPTGTYFYLLDLGNENIKTTYKGYIQLQY